MQERRKMVDEMYTRGHIKRNIELFLEDSVFGLVWPDKR